MYFRYGLLRSPRPKGRATREDLPRAIHVWHAQSEAWAWSRQVAQPRQARFNLNLPWFAASAIQESIGFCVPWEFLLRRIPFE